MTSPTAQKPYNQRTRSKSPRSRPTTPLRPSSRSSLRDSAQRIHGSHHTTTTPLELLQDDFAELSDAMAMLEDNFLQLQLMHESLSRFSESFAGFLYGMNMNAFCVDFPEVSYDESAVTGDEGASLMLFNKAPIPESFKRQQNNPDFSSSVGHSQAQGSNRGQDPNVPDVEATFLTTDTSFVENPPTSTRTTSTFQTPAKSPSARAGRGRGAAGIPRGGRGGIPTRGGGIPRGTRGGSGIARGSARGRGRGV